MQSSVSRAATGRCFFIRDAIFSLFSRSQTPPERLIGITCETIPAESRNPCLAHDLQPIGLNIRAIAFIVNF